MSKKRLRDFGRCPAALPALPLDQDRTAQLLGLADTDEGNNK